MDAALEESARAGAAAQAERALLQGELVLLPPPAEAVGEATGERGTASRLSLEAEEVSAAEAEVARISARLPPAPASHRATPQLCGRSA